jgi:hypothetical protein
MSHLRADFGGMLRDAKPRPLTFPKVFRRAAELKSAAEPARQFIFADFYSKSGTKIIDLRVPINFSKSAKRLSAVSGVADFENGLPKLLAMQRGWA